MSTTCHTSPLTISPRHTTSLAIGYTHTRAHTLTCAQTQTRLPPSPLPSRHTTSLAIGCPKHQHTKVCQCRPNAKSIQLVLSPCGCSEHRLSHISPHSSLPGTPHHKCSLHPAVWGLVLDTKKKGPKARLLPPCTHTPSPYTPPHPSPPLPPPLPPSAAE